MHSLQNRATDNLRYIRETMESAGSFTAVPGWGGVLMGVTALFAAVVAASQITVESWLKTWVAEAGLALLIGGVEIGRKLHSTAKPLLHGPGRKFALSLTPAFLVGALLTYALSRVGAYDLIPAVWLLLYGAG